MKTSKLNKAYNALVSSGKKVTIVSFAKELGLKYNQMTDESKETLRTELDERIRQTERLERMKSEKAQKKVKSIYITIDWKKSATWGYNPHANAKVEYKDGTRAEFYDTASGCGYCKGSTVFAGLLNQCLKYKLWNLKKEGLPYGINIYETGRVFAGGVGMGCYTGSSGIIAFIGGTIKTLSNSDTFESYEIKFR